MIPVEAINISYKEGYNKAYKDIINNFKFFQFNFDRTMDNALRMRLTDFLRKLQEEQA